VITRLRQGALFAGIGGICTSFYKLGYQAAFVNELELAVAETYSLNYKPQKLISGSVAKIIGADLEHVDVLHGGFPCQSFSIAGERRGFDDPRGQLFFEIVRLIREQKEKKPKVLVLENSPNLLIGNDGAWFRKIVHELTKSGYWFDASNAVMLNTANHSGVPQSRERLFMIALNADYFDGNPVRQSDFPKVNLRHISEFIDFTGVAPENYYLSEENKYSRLILEKATKESCQLYQLRKFEVRLPPLGMCPTLTANMGQGGHNVPFLIVDGRVRKLTEYECLNLQGFSSDFIFPKELSLGKRYTMVGNAVSPPISLLIAHRVNTLLAKVN
jgi:DNA (cytosine-5)-methyltransferase 1